MSKIGGKTRFKKSNSNPLSLISNKTHEKERELEEYIEIEVKGLNTCKIMIKEKGICLFFPFFYGFKERKG